MGCDSIGYFLNMVHCLHYDSFWNEWLLTNKLVDSDKITSNNKGKEYRLRATIPRTPTCTVLY